MRKMTFSILFWKDLENFLDFGKFKPIEIFLLLKCYIPLGRAPKELKHGVTHDDA